MIDWYALFTNSLWIVALALALATLGFSRWQARQEQIKLGQVLNRPGWQIALNISGTIFCLGLAATSQKIWERVLWLVMGLLFGFQIWLAARSVKK